MSDVHLEWCSYLEELSVGRRVTDTHTHTHAHTHTPQTAILSGSWRDGKGPVRVPSRAVEVVIRDVTRAV